MFNNKAFDWKIVICLLVIIASFAYSNKAGRFINPSFWICQLRPDDFNGRLIWIPYTTVEKDIEDGFIVNTNGHRISVIGNHKDYKEGSNVSIVGKFTKSEGGGYIELQKIHKPQFTIQTRLVANIISLIMLIYVAILFLRTFELRLSQGILQILSNTIHKER